MRDAMNIEIAIGAALVVTDFAPHPLRKYLRATARQRIQAGLDKRPQHLLVAHAVQIRKKRNLHRGEALQVDARPDPFESAQQLRVVTERQLGVQAVDDVQLGERLIGPLAQLVPRLFERHRIRLGHAGLQPCKRTEHAARFADIRRLEPQVVVVVGARGMTPLALAIRQPADGEQIGRLEQPNAIVEREPFATAKLFVDVSQTGGCKACLHGTVKF
jgi:hypothetical protein